MTVLTTLSNDLAAIVESVGRGVVQVDARRGGAGSGVVWTANDLVVTANHVVARDEDIRVSLGDGQTVEGTISGRDPTTDIALLRLSKPLGTSLEWVPVDGLKAGHLVLALGRPGKSVRAALGIVSALGESWRTSAGGVIDVYIETDTPAYQGFSGGPLVTAEGKVVGVTTSGLLRNTTVTLPTATVKSVIEQLLKNGRISRGYLGVGVQPARLPAEFARQSGQETGLLVMSVDAGTPGEKAGLVLGDTILAISGQKMAHRDDLLAVLGKDQIGKTVAVQILRGGHVQEIQVTIGERP